MGRVKEINTKINKAKNTNNAGHYKKTFTPRIKMPNFEAIHRKQFKKMESIIDHVARKAERARELTKSTAKKSTKKPLMTSNGLVGEENLTNKKNKDINDTINANQTIGERVSKARQKINFNSNKNNNINNKLPSVKEKTVVVIQKRNNNHRDGTNKNNNKENLKKDNEPVISSDNSHQKSNSKFKPITSSSYEPLKKNNLCTSRQAIINKTKSKENKNSKENEYVKNIRVNRRFELQMAFRNRKE